MPETPGGTSRLHPCEIVQGDSPGDDEAIEGGDPLGFIRALVELAYQEVLSPRAKYAYRETDPSELKRRFLTRSCRPGDCDLRSRLNRLHQDFPHDYREYLDLVKFAIKVDWNNISDINLLTQLCLEYFMDPLEFFYGETKDLISNKVVPYILALESGKLESYAELAEPDRNELVRRLRALKTRRLETEYPEAFRLFQVLLEAIEDSNFLNDDDLARINGMKEIFFAQYSSNK